MSTVVQPGQAVEYPDSDGQPMAENTKQYRWIVTIKENLEIMFRDQPDVFVAGDNLIYAKQGNPKVRAAPDVYVAVGRPKGDRGSYKVWEEGNRFPQAVFEVLSPGNRPAEMTRKFHFYEKYGASEYYIFDPDTNELTGFVRGDGGLDEVEQMDGFVSPILGIRFDLSGPELVIYRPDGTRFLSSVELAHMAEQAEAERGRAEAERQRAESAELRAARLAAKLRELGVDPDAV